MKIALSVLIALLSVTQNAVHAKWDVQKSIKELSALVPEDNKFATQPIHHPPNVASVLEFDTQYSKYRSLRVINSNNIKTLFETTDLDKKKLVSAEFYLASGLVQETRLSMGPRFVHVLKSWRADTDFPKRVGAIWTADLEEKDYTGTATIRKLALVVVARMEGLASRPDVPGPFYIVRSSVDPKWNAIWSESLGWPVEVNDGFSRRVALAVQTKASRNPAEYFSNLLKKSGNFSGLANTSTESAKPEFWDLAIRYAPSVQPTEAIDLGIFRRLTETPWKQIGQGQVHVTNYTMVGPGVVANEYSRYYLLKPGIGRLCSPGKGGEVCLGNIRFDANAYSFIPDDPAGTVTKTVLANPDILVTTYKDASGEHTVGSFAAEAFDTDPDVRQLAIDSARTEKALSDAYMAKLDAESDLDDARWQAEQDAKDAETAARWAPFVDSLRAFNDGLASKLRQTQTPSN